MSGIGNTGSGLETEEERKQKISALNIQTKQRIFTHQIKMDGPLVLFDFIYQVSKPLLSEHAYFATKKIAACP